jgi:hypothetical protein
MAEVIVCPECDNKMKIPERLLGKKVKCPNCKAVIDTEAPEEAEEAEEVEERRVTSRSSRSRARDRDEDEVRPRRRRDEEDEEDRPRRRRREEEDEDEEEEAPRRAKKGRDPREVLGWARLSALLCFIGACVSLGALGFMLITHIIVVSSFPIMNPTSVIPKLVWWMVLLLVAIPGIGGTLTADVGLVFGFFGPHKKGALGFCIAAVALAGVHLLLLVLGFVLIDRRGLVAGQILGGGMDAQWARLGTTLTAFQALAMADFFFDALFFITALVEVARLVLVVLWARAVLLNYKESSGLWLGAVIALGAMVVVLPLIGLLGRMRVSSLTGAKALMFFTIGLTDLAIIGGWVFVFLMTTQLRNRLASARAR